ncbi:MAG: 5'-methylthioadenosine/adenosylhomocysteine nucleosidase [Muribaculaceae bacterium]|nr:5'-methylthioadenosine/adenosylhomocysteine nucleosidase [Muribaculaceae bacterium]
MKIGIIAAMSKELNLLKPLLQDIKEIELGLHSAFQGSIHSNEITAMQCGIGKVNAAIGTQLLIDRYHPDAIINTGVAGGASAQVKIMDIVAGETIAYHDVWCGPESQLGAVQGLPLYYTGSDRLLNALPDLPEIKRGLICSGDQFIDKPEMLSKITAQYPQVLAVDMESAAIAQVCYIYRVPMLSLRIISDSPAADNNTEQYDNFWADAPQHSFQIIKELLSKL